jgi:adenylate cyclase
VALARLEQLGKFIFNFLLPPTLQEVMRRLPADSPLILATDDTELPWELMHDGRHYVALKHAVGRRLLSVVPVRQNPGQGQEDVSFLFIDNPTGDLPESQREVQNLIADCDAAPDNIMARRLSQRRATKAAVLPALASGSYSLVHYSGHATPAALALADGDLTTDDIQRVLNGQPFIFINACHSAQAKEAPAASAEALPYAGLNTQSLAAAFILGGAVGFIGTLWEVFDTSSREFAEWFYALALNGMPVGEALRHTRKRLQQTRPDDPLWASFVFYGDPTLRLTRLERPELRSATVLAVRFTGFLPLFEALDLERATQLKKQALAILLEASQRYDGQVEGLLAQSLSARFGAPETRGDETERALRAALEMVQGWQVFNQKHSQVLPLPLSLHLGISSGRVVGQQGHSVTYQIFGKAADLASELAARAGEGQVWIDEASYKLTHNYFAVEPLPPLILAEAAPPVTVFQVLGPKEAGLPLPEMFGRQVELNQLQEWWAEVKNGQGRLVSVVGQAGVGKTHLVRVFKESLTGQTFRWLIATGQSYHRTTSYAFLAQLMRGLAEITTDDDDPSARFKLLNLIQATLPETQLPAQARQHEALALLGRVVGWPYPEPTVDMLEPEPRQRKLVGLLQAIFQQSAQQPLVILLEDLHWIDEASLAVLEQLLGVSERLPILWLAVYRSDWANEWSRRVYFRHIALGELEPEAQRALLADRLGVESVPEPVAQTLLSRTGGNPYFIEEMARSLRERGAFIWSSQAGELSLALAETPLTNRIETIILSRLDRLTPAGYETLQKAAVIGQEFEYPVLAAVMDEAAQTQLDRNLDDLRGRSLIDVVSGWYPPDITYTFRHDIIRQTIYTHLPEKFRCTIHRRVAQSLEQLGEVSGSPERLAYHYDQSDNRAKAADYSLKAAQWAAAAWANQTALSWYDRALAHLQSLMEDETEGDIAGEITPAQLRQWQVEALVGQAEVQSALGNNQTAITNYQRALDLVKSSTVFPVNYGADLYCKIAIAHQDKGEFEAAEEVLQQGLALVPGLACLEAGRLYIWLGLVHFRRGRLAEGLAAWRRGIPMIEAGHNNRDLAQAYNLRGMIYNEMGRNQEAISDHHQSMALYQAIGYIPGLARVYSNLGCVYYDLSQWDEALHYFQQSTVLSEQTGQVWWCVAAEINLGEIYRPRGELEQAIQHYERARQIGQQAGFTELVALALVNLGASFLKQGELAAARNCLEESLDIYRRIEAEVHFPEILRYKAELHVKQGQPQAALPVAQEALDWALKLEHPMEEGLARRVLALVQRELGQLAQAEDGLNRSLAILEAQDNPYEVALTLLDLALLRQLRVQAGKAENSLRPQGIALCDQAIDIFNRLGARLDLELAQQTRDFFIENGNTL